MPKLSDYKATAVRNVLLAGYPKGSGKSTAAMSAPGNKLLLQYDLGSPTLPPGVDPETVFVRVYPPAMTEVKLDSDKWKRPKNVGAEIIEDIFKVREAVIAGVPPVVGGETMPWPLRPGLDSIILDGFVQKMQHVLDWVLAVNAKANPEDFENKYTAWGKRLNQERIMLDMILPLPVNVVITTWIAAEKETRVFGNGKAVEVDTGRVMPDLGGKLNIWGPGKMDTAFYLFSRKSLKDGLRFMAKVKPDENFTWVGSRNNYDEKSEVDLTISEKDKSLPWARLFG